MREHVRHDARQPSPFRLRARQPRRVVERASASKSCDHSVVGTSVMPPSSPLGGRERTSTKPSARRTTNAAPRRSLPSRFGRLAREGLRIAALARRARRPSTGRARRPASSACRWWRRGPSAPARNRRCARPAPASASARGSPAWRPAVRARSRTVASPRARHCRRRPPPAHRTQSPRSPPPCRGRCRGASPVPARLRETAASGRAATALRAGMQIAGARVVAEPGPQPQHVVERRRRERLHVRPALDEAREIRRHRPHGGLLQHDLGEPHPVRVGGLAGLARATAARGGGGRTRRAAPPGRAALFRSNWRMRQRSFSHEARSAVHCAAAGPRFRGDERWLDRAFRFGASSVMGRSMADPFAMNKPARTRARPLSELLGKTLGDAFARQGFASTELVTRWTDIVGPEIAAHSEPEKIQWPRPLDGQTAEPGTLVLRVEGPTAIEIQHLSAVILERVNRFFGWQAIAGLRLRQAPLRRERPPPGGRARSGRDRGSCPRDAGNRGRKPAPGARPAGRRHQTDVRLGRPSCVRRAIATIAYFRIATCSFRAPVAEGTDREYFASKPADRDRNGRDRCRRQRLLRLEPGPSPPAPPAAQLPEAAMAELMVPGPLGEQSLGKDDAPGHGHRICLDDLPALRPFPRDGLPGIQEGLHRHRQGALHLPRIPARSAGRRRLHAGALRRQGQVLPDDRHAVRPAEGLGGAEAAGSRCWRSPSRPASPRRRSTPAWRIRRCSTASRRSGRGRRRSSRSPPPRRSSSTARCCVARPRWKS